ncbi:MAG: hypothetical protein RL556_294 [Actinomycetota bacterium]|jgi:branched-subunit amino acid aminotransferase/4-amino-4-deoxychorismate lyase
MTLEGEFYRYQSGSLTPAEELLDEVKLAAADSWLVENGRVRSLRAHEQRFGNWVENAAPELKSELPAFFSEVSKIMPREGRWFPRIELHLEDVETPSLYVRIRKAPEQLGAIRLYTYPEPDPRQHPTIKGPDLSLCMQLRRNAQMHSADETVLVDEEGFISEGALTSIVWLKNNILFAPDRSNQWLDSITRKEVFEIAKQCNLEIKQVRAKPQDLENAEVWALSSLQGIRPVTAWNDEDGNPTIKVAGPKRFESFCKRLRMLAAPLDEIESLNI